MPSGFDHATDVIGTHTGDDGTRAVVVARMMEPEELRVREIEPPVLVADAVRIAVGAAGCNFSDLLMLKGEYQVKPALPFVPGGEVGGIVSEIGTAVSGVAVGDRVLSRCALGGFARYPNIRMLLSEQDTVWVPYVVRKMDHAFLMGRPGDLRKARGAPKRDLPQTLPGRAVSRRERGPRRRDHQHRAPRVRIRLSPRRGSGRSVSLSSTDQEPLRSRNARFDAGQHGPIPRRRGLTRCRPGKR